VNKIVKVVVKNKSNTLKFEKFIDKLYSVGVADLKIVENFDFSGWYDKETDEVIQSEDTLSILDRYIEESETELDKSRIQSLIREIYQEACELV
jgi:MoaA/NifB/PqqE/SkfB family radical SAM enzyme